MAEGAGLENRYMHPHIAGSNPALFANYAKTQNGASMAKRAVLLGLLVVLLAAATTAAVLVFQDNGPKSVVVTGLMPDGEAQQLEYHYFDSEEEQQAWLASR